MFLVDGGITEEQKEIQRVALDFAKNEMAPHMHTWDMEVSLQNFFTLMDLPSSDWLLYLF